MVGYNKFGIGLHTLYIIDIEFIFLRNSIQLLINLMVIVIPAEAGIQGDKIQQTLMDPCFCRDDKIGY